MIVTLTGFMGCGKSSTGRALSRLTGLRIVDLDRSIEQATGRTIPEIFSSVGEPGFRAIELATLKDILARVGDEGLIISLGGGTITVPEARDLILSQTRCVYLHASLDKIRANIGSKALSRPLFQDPSQVEALYNARLPLYRQAPVHIYMDNLTPNLAAERICRLISDLSPETS